MSEETLNDNADNTEDLKVDELEMLKARAKQIGINFHPSIGLEKLRAKVNEALTGEKQEEEAPAPEKAVAAAPVEEHRDPDPDSTNPDRVIPPIENKQQRIARKRREASELVRVRVSCMNPNKKEWEGEIFTVSNSVVGTHKKYVPFNAEDGWHVPRIIYNQLVNRKCQIFVTKKDARGNRTRVGKLIKEFSVEVLPNLDQKAIDDLARKQAMARGGED